MSTKGYKAKVNGKYEFNLDNVHAVNQEVVSVGDDTFHVIQDNKSIEAKIVSSDLNSKKVSVEIDGEVFAVDIQDSFDQLVKEMGLSATASKKITDIKAPMPGLVLDIMVKEGDQLAEGDGILILEAMKMENVIKAPGDITIKNIMIKKGDAVEKNQNLITLE